MKKILFVCLVTASVTFISSCKKDYTCKCTTYGISSLSGSTKNTKKKANEYCDGLESTTLGRTCEAVEE